MDALQIVFCCFLYLSLPARGTVLYNVTAALEIDIESTVRSFNDCELATCDNSTVCNCDNLCHSYRDCCEEYALDSTWINDSALFPQRNKFECVYPGWGRFLFENKAYFMVTKCPSLWVKSSLPSGRITAIRQLCEVIAKSIEPPITQITTGLVYKNRYCALCNKVSINEMIEWQSAWTCEYGFVPIYTSDIVTVADVYQFCEPDYFVPPKNLTINRQLRKCDFTMISHCPYDNPKHLQILEYEALVNNCTKFGFGRVNYWHSNKYGHFAFPNPYCAICNLDQERLSDHMCVPSSGGQSGHSFTFSMFFDPLSDNPDIEMAPGRMQDVDIVVHTNKTCTKGAVYLPYTNVCREKVYFGGNESSDCNYISLNASEYTSIDSVTLLRLVDNKTYAIEGLDGSNNPIICYLSVSFSANTSTTEHSEHTLPFGILSNLGFVVDVIAGLLIVVTYYFCLQSRALYTYVLLNMVAIYVVGDAVVVIGGAIYSSLQDQGFCIALGIGIHFTFLARFFSCTAVFCVAVRTFYFAWKVIPPTEETKSKRCQYLALCLIPVYSLSATIVVVCIAFNFSLFGSVGYGSRQASAGVCWMDNVVALSVSFATPLCLSLLVNTICFIFCSFVIIRHAVLSRINKTQASPHQRTLFEEFRILFALFSVSGTSWICFVFAMFPGVDWRRYVWATYIFIILNYSQLFLVALAYVCTKKVLKKYYNLLSGMRSRLATFMSSAGSATKASDLSEGHSTTSV